MIPVVQGMHLTHQPRLGLWLHLTTHQTVQAPLARYDATQHAAVKVFLRKRRRAGQTINQENMPALTQDAVLVSLHSIVTKVVLRGVQVSPAPIIFSDTLRASMKNSQVNEISNFCDRCLTRTFKRRLLDLPSSRMCQALYPSGQWNAASSNGA
jgi:hypothetical protein